MPGTAEIQDLALRMAEEMERQHKSLRGMDIGLLAQNVVRTFPSVEDNNPMMDAVGPFYDTAGLQRWLATTRQNLGKRSSALQILACKTEDNHLLYPTWQFRRDGTVINGLTEVLTVLAQGTASPWTWALWLTSKIDDELEGMSPAEWLGDERTLAPVLTMAASDAAVWAA
ncbi:hypothetical protein IV500_05175 [Paeniglutamicibacter antarcticus]|uniref:Uncharacterized protein n=1 Tax=Arthrobacter terrae TaxID=2935737 RepID=A0A931CPV4_9MICC|nr:hypothetical protein [Arthrobacter terrae]MBG0738811.1 hypothetical protein [Arthrobacter terrae]